MSSPGRQRFEHGFRLTVLAGVVANFLLGFAGLLFPDGMLDLLGFDHAYPNVWVRFSCVLLIVLSLFYVPPALSLETNRAAAVLTVVARLTVVAFFLAVVVVLQYSARFLIFAVYDLVFGVLAGIFLWGASRAPTEV